MFQRHLANIILKFSKEYPLIALVGPRQSGKTTLSQHLFPNHKYLSLEALDIRQHAETDPRGFLDDHGPNLILDEVQRVPALFSYLQERVDKSQKPGEYILTGSSQFLLIHNITQSLAGRIATFNLYPLTYTELYHYPPDLDFDSLFQKPEENRKKIDQQELYKLLLNGFYPRIHDKHLESRKWYENYLLTYVERDVRSLLNIKNIRTFEHFLQLCASQSANLMAYSNISNSLGVSVPTIKEWISILETSGLIFILPPYFENYSKRIVKTPKIYFADTGLLCYLLSIRNEEQLKVHPLLGSIFETFIVSECFKRFYNMGERPPLYFWRDQTGNEIDLLIHRGKDAFPIEIKLSQSTQSDFKKTIMHWFSLETNPASNGAIIYSGDSAQYITTPVPFIPWFMI